MKISVRLIVGTQRGILAQKHDGLWGFLHFSGTGVAEEDWKRIATEGLEKFTGIPSSPGHHINLKVVRSKSVNKKRKPKRLSVLARVVLSDTHIVGNLSPPLRAVGRLKEVWFEDMTGIDFNTHDMLTLIDLDLYKSARHAV